MIERRSQPSPFPAAATPARRSVEDFGSNSFCYMKGDDTRYETKRVRTILPNDGESNEQFERRMDAYARLMLANPDTFSVSADIDMLDGSHAKCTMTIVHAPIPAPIAPDARPAGKRFSERGGRGGGGGR